MQASEQTGGIFDVTCAPLINLWGFGFTKFDSITPQLVDSIRHFVGFRKVHLQLSYRQDNENSSVNSSAKVFCVNTEYAEIERWIREDYARDHASDDVARMLKFNQLIKYDSYMWNYVRLAPKFYKEFLVQMAKEFQAALDAGDFSLDDLKPWKRANLAAILKDPEGWVDEHPSFATDGALGRAKYYASVGGPGVVAAFLIESLRG